MRIAIYVLIIVIYILSLKYKSTVIEKNIGKERVSIKSEWMQYGRPVFSTFVKKENFVYEEKITGKLVNQRKIVAIVPSTVRKKMFPGQKFIASINAKKCSGKVSSIYLDKSSGFHKIELLLNSKVSIKNGVIIVVRVQISKKMNSKVVENDAVLKKDNKNFLFQILKNTIKQTEVIIGDSNNEYTTIVNGSKIGDQVVVSDQRYLSNGEFVNIIAPFGDKK